MISRRKLTLGNQCMTVLCSCWNTQSTHR